MEIDLLMSGDRVGIVLREVCRVSFFGGVKGVWFEIGGLEVEIWVFFGKIIGRFFVFLFLFVFCCGIMRR